MTKRTISTSRRSFFFQAEYGIRDAQESRGLGDVYKREVSASFDTSPSAAEVTDAPQLAEGLAPCDSTAARGASRSAAQPKLCTDSRSDLERDESMQFASLLRRRLAYGAGYPDPRQDSLRRPPGRRDPLSQRRPHPRVDEVAGCCHTSGLRRRSPIMTVSSASRAG